MRRQLICLTIIIALLCSMVPAVGAADPAAMTDIDGHWANAYIVRLLDAGYLSGTSDTTFAPDAEMSRAMFVTLLGRMAGIDPDDYRDGYLDTLYTDVPANAWYAPYVYWATRCGIASGTGDGKFSPNAPVTREQIATFAIRFTSTFNYELWASESTYVDSFTDAEEISAYANDAVQALRTVSVLSGFLNEDGSRCFAPKASATRAEAASMACRLLDAMHPYEGRTVVEPDELWLDLSETELLLGRRLQMAATLLPEDATNRTITWVSSDPSIAKVDRDGTVTALREGTAVITGITWNGITAACTVDCQPDRSLGYAGESYEDKCIRIFGETVDDHRTYYDIDDTSYLVEVPVQVWDFTDDTYTEKYTKTIYLQVHQNIAATVQAIFAEIYNGPEQFPISDAGGYYTSDFSEHDPGLALDINWFQNYECHNDGTPMTGDHWTPEEDPYSIPADGDVVRAFKKYGFGWGGDWVYKKDYMHFSYFST